MASVPRVAVVNETETARGYAHDVASNYWYRMQSRGSWPRRLGKSVVGSMLRDYRIQNDTESAMDGIIAAQDPLLYEANPAESAGAREATLARSLSGEATTLHPDERWQELPADSAAARTLKDPIRDYVEGSLDYSQLHEQAAHARTQLRAHPGDMIVEPDVVGIDNTSDVARIAKNAALQGEDVNHILADMGVVMSEAHTGVRTSPRQRYTMIDRAIEKINSSKLGLLLQPEVVIPAATIALGTAMTYVSERAAALKMALSLSPRAVAVANKIVSTPSIIPAALLTAAPAVVAGAWMGLRENKHMKDDRAQHMREMAQGKSFLSSDTRRQELESTRYSTIAANELSNNLRDCLTPEKLEAPGGLIAARNRLAATIARQRVSDRQGIDLISYSSPATIAEERWELELAIADAQAALKGRLTPEALESLGLGASANFDSLLQERVDDVTGELINELADKDGAFSRLKRRAVLSVATQGAVFGLLAGLLVQEGVAAASDSQTGLVEQLWHGGRAPDEGMHRQTLLDSLVHGDRSTTETHVTTTTEQVQAGTKSVVDYYDTKTEVNTVHHEPSSTYEKYTIGSEGTLAVSSDHSVVLGSDGTLSLVDLNGNVTIDHLAINPDGSLPEASVDMLRQHGMSVESIPEKVEYVSQEAQTVSVATYMNNHQDATLPVERDAWLLNDTTDCDQSDHNELALDWGGTDRTGVAADDTIQMNFGSATPDGSFQGDISVSPQASAEDGNLMLLVTPTHDWQSEPIAVPFNSDLTVNIEPGSAAAPFFGVDESGHAYIKADFVEVAHVTGTDDAGTTHVNVLATAAGTHTDGCLDTGVHEPPIEEVQDTVAVSHEREIPAYHVTTSGYSEEVSTTVRVPVSVEVPVMKTVSVDTSETTVVPAITLPAAIFPFAFRRSLRPASLKPAAAVVAKPKPVRRSDWYADTWPKLAQAAPAVAAAPVAAAATVYTYTQSTHNTPPQKKPTVAPVEVRPPSAVVAAPVAALALADEAAAPVTALALIDEEKPSVGVLVPASEAEATAVEPVQTLLHRDTRGGSGSVVEVLEGELVSGSRKAIGEMLVLPQEDTKKGGGWLNLDDKTRRKKAVLSTFAIGLVVGSAIGVSKYAKKRPF